MSIAISSLRAAIAVPPWVKNELWRRARALPSLDLRFADNKSLVDAVTGQLLVTFTRASSGTFVGSDGVLQTASTDVPRFDHNPTTGESLGLLMGESRTNLLLRSEEFGDAYWSKVNATITADSIAAPTGAITADSLIETAATGQHRVFRGITGTTNTNPHVVSFFAKANTRTRVYVGLAEGTTFSRQGNAVFDLSAGTIVSAGVGSNGSTGGAATIQNFGNGWYRCTYTLTFGGTDTTVFTDINLVSTGTAINYTGDGTSGLFLWGAQLEAGAFPTSYIPTTTAAVTRSASLADLISSAIANNIRSFYVEFRSPAIGTRGVVSLNDNTANERASVLTSGTDPRLVVHDGGVEQANVNGGTAAAGVKTRVAVRINTNDFAISINGGAVATDTSGTLPTVDRLIFGRTQAGEYLNGTIARFTGWTELLSNATLQTLAQ